MWSHPGCSLLRARGLGFSSVVQPAALLLAYTLAFFGLAVWRSKFEA